VDRLRNRKPRGVQMKVHPELFKICESERKKMMRKGIKKVSQIDITKSIAQNLKRKRKGMGLFKDAKK
jgi:hypothetical protein